MILTQLENAMIQILRKQADKDKIQSEDKISKTQGFWRAVMLIKESLGQGRRYENWYYR